MSAGNNLAMSISAHRKAKTNPETLAEAQRLRAIWDNKVNKPTQAVFGEQYDIGSQSAVGFFLNGTTPLSLKAARGFAKGLGRGIADFSPRLAALASNIAASVSPDSSAAVSDNTRPAASYGRVPLISEVQAGQWADICDNFSAGEADEWVRPIASKPGKHAFALEVVGESMTSPFVGPGVLTFPEGTTIIVDPDQAADAGHFVVAKDVSTQKATFKKLMYDGGRWYLKPLNPDYKTVEIDDPAMRVIGRVIEYIPKGGKL